MTGFGVGLLLKHTVGLVDLAGAGSFSSAGYGMLWEEFEARQFRLNVEGNGNRLIVEASVNNFALSPAITQSRIIVAANANRLRLEKAGTMTRFKLDEA